MKRGGARRTATRSEGLLPALLLLLLAVVWVGLPGETEAVCTEHPLDGTTVYYAADAVSSNGTGSCDPSIAAFKRCDSLSSAMTFAMSTNENATRVVMCSDATVGADPLQDQLGIPVNISHFWLSKVGSELACYDVVPGNPACTITVVNVTKASVLLMSMDGTSFRGVKIERTHGPLANLTHNHNFTAVSDVLIYAALTASCDYMGCLTPESSPFALFARDVKEASSSPRDATARAKSSKRDARAEETHENPEAVRERMAFLERSLKESAARRFESAGRHGVRLDHLFSREAAEAGLATRRQAIRDETDRAERASVEARRSRLAARAVTNATIPSSFLKPCALNGSSDATCTLVGLVIEACDFRQHVGAGILVTANVLVDNGTYSDFLIAGNMFGYYPDEIDNCTQASALAVYPAIDLYGTIPSLFVAAFDNNDFVYATLDLPSIGGSSAPPASFGAVTALHCYWAPRPFEAAYEFRSPLANPALFPDPCSTNPYRLFPLDSAEAPLYGPVYAEDASGDAVGFCNPVDGVAWAQGQGFSLARLRFTAQVYTVASTLVVTFPTEFCSKQVPSIHGIRDPVIYFDQPNTCVPSVISVSYAFSVANLNLKFTPGTRGVLYWDASDNATVFDRFNGPCANATAVHAALAAAIPPPAGPPPGGMVERPIPRSVRGLGRNAAPRAATATTTQAKRSLPTSASGLVADNTVFEGGVWAVMMLASRPAVNLTLFQNVFVGQSIFGVAAVKLSGLSAIDNVFGYAHINDSSRWSLNSTGADPQFLAGQVPAGAAPAIDGTQAGLALYACHGVQVSGNHFWKNNGYGLAVYGGPGASDLRVSCNTFVANVASGVRSGCYSDGTPNAPNPVVHCAGASALFGAVRAEIADAYASQVPVDSCVDLLRLHETLGNAAWNNATFVRALADRLEEIAESGSPSLPNAAYVQSHALELALAAFDTVLAACGRNVDAQGLDFGVVDVLDPSLPCGAPTFHLFEQVLFYHNVCDGQTVTLEPGNASAPFLGPCAAAVPGLVLENNAYTLNTLLTHEGFVNPVASEAGNVHSVTVLPATPYLTLIDLAIDAPQTVNAGPLSLAAGTDDAFSSTALLPYVEDALGSCQNPNLIEWRSFVYYEKLAYAPVCVSVPESTPLSEVVTVSSDAKRADLEVPPSEIQWSISEANIAAKTGLSPSAALCEDMDLASRDSWLLTRAGSCRNVSGSPACGAWTHYDYASVSAMSSACFPVYDYPADRFVTQFVLSTPPVTNITFYMDCSNSSVFDGLNDPDNLTYVVTSFNQSLEILKALPPLLTFNANVTIAYFGNCLECIVFSNVSFHITVRPFALPGTQSFLIHPYQCPNHVVVEYSANIRFLHTHFRSGLPQNADEAYLDPASLDPEGLVLESRSIVSPSSAFASSLAASFHAGGGHKSKGKGGKDKEKEGKLAKRALPEPPAGGFVPLTWGTDRFLGCQEVPFAERQDHYLRSLYIDASSDIRIEGATFAAYERIEAVGMIFSVNVSVHESVFAQQVTGVTVYSEVSRYNATVGADATVKLGRRGIEQLIKIWNQDRVRIENSTFALGQNGVSVRLCKTQDNLINPDFYLSVRNNSFSGNEGVSLGVTGVAYVPQLMGGSFDNVFYGLTDTPSETPRIAVESGLDVLVLDYPVQGGPPGAFVTKHVLNSLQELLADNKGSYSQNQGISFNGGYLVSSGDRLETAFYNTFQVGGGLLVNGTFADGSKTTFDSSDHVLQPYQHASVVGTLFRPNAIVQVTTHAFDFITEFNDTRFNAENFFTKPYDLCKQTLTDVAFHNVTDVRTGAVLIDKPPPGGFPSLAQYIDPKQRTLATCSHNYEQLVGERGQDCDCVDIGDSFKRESRVTAGVAREYKVACPDFTQSLSQNERTKCVDPRPKPSHRTKLESPPTAWWIAMGVILGLFLLALLCFLVIYARRRDEPARR